MSSLGYAAPDEAAINKTVTSEVEGEIKSEVAPLETLAGQTERNRDQALAEIGEAFGFVVDSSKQSAVRLGQDYAQARQFEKGIFDAATRELAEIRGNAAAEAQRMAQLTGGPVDVNSFLEPSLVESGLASSDFATAQLMHSGFGQANVALAESYAGQTFPLMRAREKKAALNHYNDQIESIRREIATIKQSKGTRVSKAARERLLQEREFALQKAIAERESWAQKQGINIEKDRIKLEKDRIKLQEGELTGTYGGKPTLGKQQLTAQQKEAAAARAAQKGEAASANRKEAGKLVDAVTTPGVQEYTQTRKVEAGPGTAGAFRDDESPTGWSQYKDVKVRDAGGPAMTRPTQIYDYLLQQGIPSGIAISAVRNWLRTKGVSNANTWVPGQAKSDDMTRGRGKPKEEGKRPDAAKTEGKGGGGPEEGPTRSRPSGHPKAQWRRGAQGWGWYEEQTVPGKPNLRTGGVTQKKVWKKVG